MSANDDNTNDNSLRKQYESSCESQNIHPDVFKGTLTHAVFDFPLSADDSQDSTQESDSQDSSQES